MSARPNDLPGSGRAGLDMAADEFRALGHDLVDLIAAFYDTIGERKLTNVKDPAELELLLGDADLPEHGTDPAKLLSDVAPLLFDHSLHNGHPKFMGYITSSAAPIGALADLLAASLNANLARWDLSPVASEIEVRALRWVAELIGYDPNASGIMVSGGNMANFTAFFAARTKLAPWSIREDGNYADTRRLTTYVSAETHTWIQKAADVCGLGSSSIRWIETDPQGRMRLDSLRKAVIADRNASRLPFFVVANGGSVSQGVVDPLPEIAALCREYGLWLHVDGAYGAPAATLAEAPKELRALALADSVAVDPHKWLYCPIEVACVLTRHKDALQNAFSFSPEYYRLAGRKPGGTDFYELGMQNTRGFRALKVWLLLQATGRTGILASIREDIRLASRLHERIDRHPDLEAHVRNLSISTFRYHPRDLQGRSSEATESYLNALNQAILAELQSGGELFLSNAVVNERYLLRACIVNFRTSAGDIDAVPEAVATIGRRLDEQLRHSSLP